MAALIVLIAALGCAYDSNGAAPPDVAAPTSQHADASSPARRTEKPDSRSVRTVEELLLHGRKFETGSDLIPQRPEYAAMLYAEAIERGSAESKCRLAVMLLGNRGVEADLVRAKSLLEESLAAGVEESGYWLGTRLCVGADGFQRDCAAGFPLVMRGAERDDPEAILFVGDAYATGDCVTQDLREARKWFQRGAALADPRCCRRAAELVARGEGGPPDATLAYQLNVAAVEAKYRPGHEADLQQVKAAWMSAQRDAAIAELNGAGTLRNEPSAVTRLQLLSKLKDPESLLVLSTCYQQGRGISKDMSRAYVLAVLATWLGDSPEVRRQTREIRGALSTEELDRALLQLTQLMPAEDAIKVFHKLQKDS